MKFSWIKYYLLLTFALIASVTHAQLEDPGLTQDSTLLDSEQYYEDSGVKNEEGFFAMFEGHPGRAALYSAIIPGAGQVYNKRWLKVPIVLGIEGTAIGFIVFYSKLYNEFDLAYKGWVRCELKEFRGYSDPSGLKKDRDTFKKNRDYSIIALTVVHVLNIADAFVDRHLIEFDVDEDISLRLGPTTHGLGLAIHF